MLEIDTLFRLILYWKRLEIYFRQGNELEYAKSPKGGVRYLNALNALKTRCSDFRMDRGSTTPNRHSGGIFGGRDQILLAFSRDGSVAPSFRTEVSYKVARAQGDKVCIIRQSTEKINAVYHDPGRHLTALWSYPGFRYSGISLEEAISLVKQAYDGAGKEISLDKQAYDGPEGVLSPCDPVDPRGPQLTTIASPSKALLLKVYHGLYKSHPHDLLPLETRLPEELRCTSRDQYRVIMTMILSQAIDDHRLSVCLGELFRRHPNFQNLKGLHDEQIRKLLGKSEEGGCGFGFNDPYGSGNGGRLSKLVVLYFNEWKEAITEQNIRDLDGHGSGFGPKFVRSLQAYCFGNSNMLPLDTPAFKFLQQRCSLYTHCSIDYARNDIECKLCSEKNISLIDFHEMLRFEGQTKNRGRQKLNDVVIGWNAWRLLCSNQRNKITEGWIREHLVKNDGMSKKLWDFYRKITEA